MLTSLLMSPIDNVPPLTTSHHARYGRPEWWLVRESPSGKGNYVLSVSWWGYVTVKHMKMAISDQGCIFNDCFDSFHFRSRCIIDTILFPDIKTMLRHFSIKPFPVDTAVGDQPLKLGPSLSNIEIVRDANARHLKSRGGYSEVQRSGLFDFFLLVVLVSFSAAGEGLRLVCLSF